MSKHVFRRAGFLAATIGVTGLLGAGIASAHVTANVYGTQPTKGGYGAIFFRVPNEDANAATVKVSVTVKPEYGLASVRTKPVPGWTAQVDKTQLPAPVTTASGTQVTQAVTKVTWTAQPGTKIGPGNTSFEEFQVSAGALPNLDQIEFPTEQTYDSGKVVNWNQPTPPGGGEPEHPAPVVKLAAKGASGDAHGGAQASKSGEGEHAEAASSASDNTARWLGGAGLVVGALGLGFGIGAIARSRRPAATTGTTQHEQNEEGTK
ncbi:YcnI family copper-binding membrane protein [Amycolatopsis samaneae]|uniref:YcnI family protein n=1 Tax=Amycolatopsis samaneae TaxID=664691 RepID=A0ABW5GK47_9PSEU